MNCKVVLPYPNQQASDDLGFALSLLKVVMDAMDDYPSMQDYVVAISNAVQLIEPVADLLNRNDVPAFGDQYRECRVARVLKVSGGPKA